MKEIDERRKAKDNLVCVKSPRLTQREKEVYKIKDKEVKRSARRDKESFWKRLANKAQRAAAKGGLNMHCVQDH